MWYLIYSGYEDGTVMRIDTDRDRAIDYAIQYTKDTEYSSWIIKTNITDWWDCNDDWHSDDCILYCMS